MNRIKQAPIGQLRAPFILKHVISIYNYNVFSPKTLELDVYWIFCGKMGVYWIFGGKMGVS